MRRAVFGGSIGFIAVIVLAVLIWRAQERPTPQEIPLAEVEVEVTAEDAAQPEPPLPAPRPPGPPPQEAEEIAPDSAAPDEPQDSSSTPELAITDSTPEPDATESVDSPAASLILPRIDTIDRDEEGRLAITGWAEPGASIAIHDGDEIIGEAVADEQGRFTFRSEAPLAPGEHQLGLTAVSPDGLVTQSDELALLTVPAPRPEPAPFVIDDALEVPPTAEGAPDEPVLATEPPTPETLIAEFAPETDIPEDESDVAEDVASDGPDPEPADAETLLFETPAPDENARPEAREDARPEPPVETGDASAEAADEPSSVAALPEPPVNLPRGAALDDGAATPQSDPGPEPETEPAPATPEIAPPDAVFPELGLPEIEMPELELPELELPDLPSLTGGPETALRADADEDAVIAEEAAAEEGDSEPSPEAGVTQAEPGSAATEIVEDPPTDLPLQAEEPAVVAETEASPGSVVTAEPSETGLSEEADAADPDGPAPARPEVAGEDEAPAAAPEQPDAASAETQPAEDPTSEAAPETIRASEESPTDRASERPAPDASIEIVEETESAPDTPEPFEDEPEPPAARSDAPAEAGGEATLDAAPAEEPAIAQPEASPAEDITGAPEQTATLEAPDPEPSAEMDHPVAEPETGPTPGLREEAPPDVLAEPRAEPMERELPDAAAELEAQESAADGETVAEPPSEIAVEPEQHATVPDDPAFEFTPFMDEDAGEAEPEPMAPIIDAVRVTSEGVIIIVGRGEPGSMVTIIDNGAAIGTVTVDEGGEFFFMGDAPLAPGGHQIDLLAEAPEGGEARPTEEMVLLIVPQRMETITGDPVGRPEEEGALALLVPRDDVGPTRPLQTPAPPVMSEAPSPDAETAVAEPSGEPADGQPSPSEPPPEAETVVTESLGEAAEEVPLPPSPEPPPASPAPTPAEDETAPSPALAIEVIDYDDRGRLIVSGAAPPEAQLLLYLDNILIGNGIAGPNARFEIRPEAGVVPGLYTLRLDQVDDSGRVLARVETPFQRAAPLAQRPEHGQVIVQPGNNLWRIARQTYGAGMQYTVIYQANREQIRDPDLIYPGQIFVLPDPPDSLPLGVPG